jgi:pyruvate ferredoxin oxidoreductase alpha subunit
VLASFVGGLGGRDVGLAELAAIFAATARAADAGRPPPPRLLYTEAELREVRKLQGVALGERFELARGEGS